MTYPPKFVGLITAEELSFYRTAIRVVILSQDVHLYNKMKGVPLSPEYLVTCDWSTIVLITICETCHVEMRETDI